MAAYARGLSRKATEILGRKVVSEEHRLKIAQDIGADWETLAIFIGVSDVEVSDIKQVHTREVLRSSTLMRTGDGTSSMGVRQPTLS